MAVRRRLRVLATGATVLLDIIEKRTDERCIQLEERQGKRQTSGMADLQT